RVIVPDKKNKYIKKNHSLAKFPLKKFTVENIHHTSVFLSIRIYGERNYYFYSSLHFGGNNEEITL
ncbi:MAG: hypothetical protein LGB06_08135, partial [Sulfurovum sp.]|nr:hypothetical protein [Sulfurovum sp.]